MADARHELYCHACHHQWQAMGNCIECPACRSPSTEIVGVPDDPDERRPQPAANHASQISPDNDPRQFHNRQQPSPQQQTDGTANTTTADPHGGDRFIYPPVTFHTTIDTPNRPAPSALQPGTGASLSQADSFTSAEGHRRLVSAYRELMLMLVGPPPASQAAIDKLEVKELDETMVGCGSKTAPCVVCVDDMTLGDKASVLACGHFFHGKCVSSWLKIHDSCPVCRKAIEVEEVE
ncbi:hypothetical protein B0T17DRAFT_513607 [Bombardia bombarda]|uniref:RING-type E3 ubiquitin transferase n=1 Tax=Bombardia bombarda TaxID=252184 RepID=A0AA39XIC8_9PEZI|nr:hypothetical protein B0T17DRAFT_513607 [Bombardia bombarda]